jgi:hypothetical protein
MHAIFSQSCKFHEPGHHVRFIPAGPGPVIVEDWIRKTGTYQAALDDGKIRELANPTDADKITISKSEHEEFLAWKALKTGALPVAEPEIEKASDAPEEQTKAEQKAQAKQDRKDERDEAKREQDAEDKKDDSDYSGLQLQAPNGKRKKA